MTVTIAAGSVVTAAPAATTMDVVANGSVSIGDLIVIDVRLRHLTSYTAGTDTVTLPAGWTSIGGTVEPGFADRVHRLWWKIAEAGDISPNTITINFGAGWRTTSPDLGSANITGFLTAVRINGGPITTTKSSGVFVPVLPTPTDPSLLIAYTDNGFSGGAGWTTANGWAPDSFAGPVSLPYQSPPFVAPVFPSNTNYVSWAVFSVTDIPLATGGGYRVGRVGFGPRGPGYG